MERQEMMLGVKDYFRTEQWRRMLDLLNCRHPKDAHIHLYAKGCISVDSLDSLLTKYFELRGWPLIRHINHMCLGGQFFVLHGVGPRGKPNFDLFYSWDPKSALTPGEPLESGCNLLLWERLFMEEWYSEFPFRRSGPKEREAVKQYFKSEHWKKGLALAEDRKNYTHLHLNIRTSVHPNVLNQYALEDFRERGWKIDWTYPTVYTAHGALLSLKTKGPMAGYFTKVVFLASAPMEAPFDLAWAFDPTVIVEPDLSPRLRDDLPGYDAFTRKEYDEFKAAHPWIKLTSEEVSRVAKGFFIPKS